MEKKAGIQLNRDGFTLNCSKIIASKEKKEKREQKKLIADTNIILLSIGEFRAVRIKTGTEHTHEKNSSSSTSWINRQTSEPVSKMRWKYRFFLVNTTK